MARPTDGNLELSKVRKGGGHLELNAAYVTSWLAVLRGGSLPPSLVCSPGLILPATLQGQVAHPLPAVAGVAVHPGVMTGQLAAPAVTVTATVVIEATLASTARPLLPAIEAGHDINVFRGPSHTSTDHFERAALVTRAVQSDWQRPELVPATSPSTWQEASPLQTEWTGLAEQLPREYGTVRVPFDEGLALGASNGHGFDSLPPGHAVTRSLWVEGAPVGRWQVSGFRNPPRQDKVWQADRWQEATPLGVTLRDQRWQPGLQLHKGWLSRWEEAMQPPWGLSLPPKPPIPPDPGHRSASLAFGRPRGDDASLEFVWFGQAQIVIPTRRVYLVSNTASIVRVRDGVDIPTTSLSIELDTDSWAWQFTAQIPRIAAAAMTDDEEVSIHVNGQQWDCVCDGWQSSQSFARESATLTGRSRTAYLSPTHVLPQAVSEIGAATMAQLAEALLPYGWTLDWQAPDWLVPAGFFSLDNQTPIEAIKYLAEAAGGFVLPHQRNRHLVIKPRYPTVPWQLDGELADVAIPRAIITTLGSDFQPGQAANGVWVSGGHQGISARVLRQGTAGEKQASTITHPLVCDVVAARAQGVVALAKTMPKRRQTIELPLSSDTGLILPGALLAVDGWRGFNRSVRVSAELQDRAMKVRQQLSVERFV
ncbi:hypothetical protein J9893_06610 [Aeromonas sp. MaB10011B]|uniref:hypothetical protein n=1 Tax=Aeromonas TaxID=642 RepID=UPI001B33B5CF|nr:MULTISPECIES: hypothetical protein [Aeromonas]MBP4066660.1 hypothetical protein [Aeromonas sp. MaB10011B]MBP4079047.1 hypothetical protein [Aeromonas sp. MrichA-1]